MRNDYLHGFVVAIVNDGTLVAGVLILLELEVFLEHAGEAVAFEQAHLAYHVHVVVWDHVQVEEQRHAVRIFRRGDVLAVLAFQ